MGVCNRQPLANSKGVHREMESEKPVRRGGKLAANIRAYGQKLHIRRVCVGDVAKETEALYCTEHINVNEEAA